MKTLTKIEFKIWLVTNGYTQKSLAEKLGLTQKTIFNYIHLGNKPILGYALKGLELEKAVIEQSHNDEATNA